MKVLLLDDHPLVLTAVRNVIHALDPATVVCTADNPVQALALLAEQTDVDLVRRSRGRRQHAGTTQRRGAANRRRAAASVPHRL